MAHWKKSFPGKYLQVSDLDTPIVATIANYREEAIGTGDDQERKPVIHFRESGVKAVVLNLTRAEAVEAIAGDPDTDRWPGTRICLYKGTTRYQGKRVACIAICAPGKQGDQIDAAMPTAEAF
jgi:hypothetical protein